MNERYGSNNDGMEENKEIKSKKSNRRNQIKSKKSYEEEF